jgi:MoaA/NifB/PqqE/SkfB family radical SAM enzyme
MELSTACNLRCPRCEREVADKKNLGHFTSVDTIKNLLPILKYVSGVTFTGGYGENFLHPRFWEIHRMVRSTGVRTFVFSNSLMIKDSDIEKAVKEKLYGIFISLDSLDKEKYEAIKKGTKYDVVLDKIRKFAKIKGKYNSKLPKVCINFACQNNTMDEIENVVEFAKKEKIDCIWFTGLIAHRKKFAKYSLFQMDKNDVRKRFKKVQQKAKELGIRIRTPPTEEFDNDRKLCCDPWQCMYIFYNGDVCTCPHFREPREYYFYVKDKKLVEGEIDYPAQIMGNINKENPIAIWNGKNYLELRNNFKKGTLRKPCGPCYYKYGWH